MVNIIPSCPDITLMYFLNNLIKKIELFHFRCVVVLLNGKKQSHIINSCKKTITAVKFSKDGKNLVTGEVSQTILVRMVSRRIIFTDLEKRKLIFNALVYYCIIITR